MTFRLGVCTLPTELRIHPPNKSDTRPSGRGHKRNAKIFKPGGSPSRKASRSGGRTAGGALEFPWGMLLCCVDVPVVLKAGAPKRWRLHTESPHTPAQLPNSAIAAQLSFWGMDIAIRASKKQDMRKSWVKNATSMGEALLLRGARLNGVS